MFSLRTSTQHLGALLILGSFFSSFTTGLDLDLCASFNTGETDRNQSIYQTNGLCRDFCVEKWAFAITQDKGCWCSNYYPAKAEQADLTKCDTPCPAWPSEKCGGKSVYGYLLLGNVDPSGTRGSGPDSTSGTTVTRDPSSKSATASQTDKSSSSDAGPTSKPTSRIETVTAGGTVKTVTIGPTETAGSGGKTAGEGSEINAKASSGLNTGQVVGIVVGVIGAVLIAAGIALFMWFRRKKQRQEQEGMSDDPTARDSSSGRTGRQDMSMVGGSPVSPSAAKRNSTLQIDPRMDPFNQGLYARSASQESINTLRDEHDYSRRIQAPKVLRATNPDPVAP